MVTGLRFYLLAKGLEVTLTPAIVPREAELLVELGWAILATWANRPDEQMVQVLTGAYLQPLTVYPEENGGEKVTE